ncbi:hypothetical protein [Scytonema sp. PCC 10023]|uniref:hypothetical protein n=1 Tax=Scytonema sp. PCC 10023 TaxID=1680591 RepID=UPI0039C67F8B
MQISPKCELLIASLAPALAGFFHVVTTLIIKAKSFFGVAESTDDSCGVGILVAQQIQRTGKMPIPQEHKIHPANMQRPFFCQNATFVLTTILSCISPIKRVV